MPAALRGEAAVPAVLYRTPTAQVVPRCTLGTHVSSMGASPFPGAICSTVPPHRQGRTQGGNQGYIPSSSSRNRAAQSSAPSPRS